MRIIVCDDCEYDLDSVTSLLKSCKYKDGCSIKSFSNPMDALYFVEEGADADVAFLDIIMPELSGVELAKKYRELEFNGSIIFLSTVNDFAAQSYEVKAFSYLIKPATKQTVQKVIDEIEEAMSFKDNSGFKLTWRGGGRFVLFSELVYVEVRNHHLYFHINNGDVIKIYGKLSEYANILLTDQRMAYNNRSFIFNMDYIVKCENGAVFLKDDVRISIPNGFDKFQSNYFDWMFGKKI